MIHPEQLSEMIRAACPDATVEVTDRTGTRDHYSVSVVSDVFADKSLLDRQRFVYKALAEPMADGRIHALELSLSTAAEAV